jgi:tripartite ATP-independent transporter DctP family solute receptor
MTASSISRRQVLLGAGALCAARVPLVEAATDGLMTAADVHPDHYPTVEAVRWMGRKVEEATAGRLRIRVYHAGQLGRENDTIDLARFGALDITRVNFASLNNPFPLTQAFGLPYMFESVAHFRRAADSEVGQEVLRGFEKRDLVGLAIYDSGARNFYNVRRAIHEPADLHGLKVRVPPSDIFIDLVRRLGANPTPLPYGEVYSAMQTHLIEGAENNWRTFHTSRHFEVARYWSESGHSFSPEALLMSRHTYDALSAGDQEILRSAAKESVAYMRELWDRMEIESRETVIKAGVKVNEVDRAAFHATARPVVESYLKSNHLEKLYEGIRALA